VETGEAGTKQTIKTINMKKLILSAVLLVAISSGVSAQARDTTQGPGTNKNNPGYVDNNKNNVCDNYENRAQYGGGRGQGQGQKGANATTNRQGCMNMQCRGGGNGRGRG
jgi:hypothetical protein